MAKGILAKKIGMTQLYDETGKVLPVTLLQAGPCYVTQVKTKETDNYDAIQLGFDTLREVLLSKAELGHTKKNNIPAVRRIAEFRDFGSELKAGEVVKADIFVPGEKVKVTGVSKGKGFAGVIKRHGFGGGRATHGSKFHRAPGSLGAGTFPGRVFKGVKMPGHAGVKVTSVMNLKVVRVDAENNLLYIKGAVPGSQKAYVRIEAL